MEQMMTKRSSVLSLVLLGLLSTSAMAMNGNDAASRKSDAAGASALTQRLVEAEVGSPQAPQASTKSRLQVQQELAEWRRNPVAGGWRDVGGELGWKRMPHSYVRVSGQLVHSDALTHDAARPSAASPQEKQKLSTTYGSGS